MRGGVQLLSDNTGNGADAGTDHHTHKKTGKPLQREKDDSRRYQETGTARLMVIVRILSSHSKNLLDTQISLLYHGETGKKREKHVKDKKTERPNAADPDR